MATPVEQITALYIGYFGRAPEPAGLNYWVGRLADGFSLAEIAESFSVQPEATTKYPYLSNPNLQTPASADLFITQVYMNLFNRAPDAEGLAYWRGELANGTDVGDFILNVISGAVTAPDSIIIENKVEVGVDFALSAATVPGFTYDAAAAEAAVEVINGVDATEASVDAAKAETDAFVANGGGAVGDVFTLTNELDQLVGTTNNDTFQGDVANLGAFDTIEGGAGTDTLNLIGAGGVDLNPNASISGVEIVNIATTDFVTNLNSASFAGVQQVWQIDNTAADDGFGDITVGAGVTAGFRSTGVTATAQSVADFVIAAAGVTTVSVAVDGVASGSIVAINETTAADVSTVNVSGSVAAAGVGVAGTLTIASAATDIDTLNLSLSSNTVVNIGALDDLNSFNADASIGNLTVNLGAPDELASATFGSGNDTVTLATTGFNAATTATAVNLGAGNDVLVLNAGANANANALTVVLGAGNDTVDINTLANITAPTAIAADLVTISDFSAAQDVLDLAGLTVRDVLVNTELANISGAATLEAAVAAAAAVTDVSSYSIFNYGGDAYIFNNDATAGFGAGDGLVRVIGFNVDDITAQNLVA